MSEQEDRKYNLEYHDTELAVLKELFTELEQEHGKQPGALLLVFAMHMRWSQIIATTTDRFNRLMEGRVDPYRANRTFIEREFNNFLETITDCDRKLGMPEGRDISRYLFTRDCPPEFEGKNDAGAIMRRNGARRLLWIYQDNRGGALPVQEITSFGGFNVGEGLFPNT